MTKQQTGWQQQNNQLHNRYEFADFSEALAFIVRVGLLAEAAQHHPTIVNTWNVVELRLSTHSAGGIVTDKDRELAVAIDRLGAPGVPRRPDVGQQA